MLGLVRLSPTLIRPLARKPHTINLVIKHKSRFSTHTPGNSLFPLGTYSSIVKPVLFTIGVIGGSLCLAEYAVKKRRYWKDITDSIKKALNTYQWVPPHTGTALMLISANAAVFIAMRFPFAAHVLHRNFSHSITNRRVSTFILSCFGHSGPLHIALNMYMLYTFFPPIQRAIGPERTLSLYFSAGVFASLTSHMNMLLQRSVIPSLGASGAICGLFAGFCMLYPDTKLQLLILPVFSLEAKYMLLVPICIEAALLVALRNRAGIDFAAHLGGFVFGAAYVWLLKQYANRVGRLERIVVLPREGVYDGNKILEEIREGEGENGHVKLQFSLLCLMQALESKDVRLTVSIYPEIPKFEPPVTPKDTTQPRYLFGGFGETSWKIWRGIPLNSNLPAGTPIIPASLNPSSPIPSTNSTNSTTSNSTTSNSTTATSLNSIPTKDAGTTSTPTGGAH